MVGGRIALGIREWERHCNSTRGGENWKINIRTRYSLAYLRRQQITRGSSCCATSKQLLRGFAPFSAWKETLWSVERGGRHCRFRRLQREPVEEERMFRRVNWSRRGPPCSIISGSQSTYNNVIIIIFVNTLAATESDNNGEEEEKIPVFCVLQQHVVCYCEIRKRSATMCTGTLTATADFQFSAGCWHW